MLTGNLVGVRFSKGRVIPRYIDVRYPDWLEIAESLLLIYRESIGRSRGEIEGEVADLFGDDPANWTSRGLAKVLEDRAEFEVVADLPPDAAREKVFMAAALRRNELIAQHPRRERFHREPVLRAVADEFGVDVARLESTLFADLKDENRMIAFDDISASRLLERYNVALAQAVLLRSTRLTVEVRREKPSGYRRLFRWMKFHRLLYRVEGSSAGGFVFHIDGPLSLFSATNKYGLQMALFLPALLLCENFRLDAELAWGPRREPATFHLESGDGLVSHYRDTGTYVPAEITAFLDRFHKVAPGWAVSEEADFIELGGEGVWVPDYRFTHKQTGLDVFVDVVGFWKKSSLERLLRLLPIHGPKRYVLAVSERLKVDEEAFPDNPAPILRFKEIPNAVELAAMLDRLITESSRPPSS